MAPTRAELIDHLVKTGMAGWVATPRENNLEHYRLMAEGDPYFQFGMEFRGQWSPDAVLELMARKVGVDPRLNYRRGVDTISAELTADALDRYAIRFREALRRQERVLFATGHPYKLAPMYERLAAAVADAGGTVVEVGDGASFEGDTRFGVVQVMTVEFFLGVATVNLVGTPIHSHSAHPMRVVLEEITRAGEAPPDLVVADHGWCGGAAFAGIDAIGFADSNDPALFVGEEEGFVAVAVPLDDGIAPEEYDLLADYILG